MGNKYYTVTITDCPVLVCMEELKVALVVALGEA